MVSEYLNIRKDEQHRPSSNQGQDIRQPMAKQIVYGDASRQGIFAGSTAWPTRSRSRSTAGS